MEKTVKTAMSGQADDLIAALVVSFATDPPARWMFPEPRAYLEHFPHFARAFCAGALANGSAYYVGGFAGVAMWLPPGVGPDEIALSALLERALEAQRSRQVLTMIEQLAGFHPEEPHWYLPMTGVDPTFQRRGIGSALLQHALRRVDADRLPAYLESTNPANIPLYERHGFERLGTVQAPTSPPLFPMCRRAR